MDFTFRTARVLIENALVDTLLLALGRRLPPLATRDAVAALSSITIGDDDLRFVEDARRCYRFRRDEVSAPDGDAVIAPLDLPPNAPGRWLKTEARSAVGGYLQRCELYNDDDDAETVTERLLSKKPAVLISFEGARHQPVANRAGAIYWYVPTYKLLVISTNMRGGESAWHGSARSDEAKLDPGTAAILGDIKQALAGTDLGLGGAVERVELGEERPVIVALARRTVIEELTISIWATVRREDDDLEPLEGANAHAEIVDDDGNVDFSDDAEIDFET